MLKHIGITLIAGAALLAPYAAPQASQPRIFYSDIVSGPPNGGEQNLGAIVTITGSGFGSSQGSSGLELAGSPVARILRWSERRISFQIGPNARSGDLQVISGHQASNRTRFTVTRGRIYFVSPSGHDEAAGAWSSPWRTIPHAAAAMRPGDITYVLDGVHQSSTDNYHASVSIQSTGEAAAPKALVAYPGASASIGDAGGDEFGLRTPSIRGGPFSHWVIAGFTIQGANTALRLDGVSGWRIVDNDFSCPSGDGASACVQVSGSTGIAMLGNAVHDAGKPGGSKRYQSVYFTTDSNHIEIGWNRIFRNHSCRGIQIHSSPVSRDTGFNQYDVLIHDNRISDQTCDGINLATIDPSKGRIAVYNNLIDHVGTGPSPHDGEANYACISSPGIVNRGVPGSGVVEIFNNTLYDCGSIEGSPGGAITVGPDSPDLLLNNNIIHQLSRPYFTHGSVLSKVHGAGNLWWGGDAAPDVTSENLHADPRFVSAPSRLMLSAESPAKHAAKDCAVDHDLDGQIRFGGKCSLGAFE